MKKLTLLLICLTLPGFLVQGQQVNSFTTKDGSPCINSGVDSVEFNGVWYFAPSLDIECKPRSDSDMGAFENDLTTGYFWHNNALRHISY